MVNPSFKIIEDKKDKSYGRFIVEPLEPGFGNTLGVALRRVLLTSIEGAAITSVKIDNVRHLFSTLPGLKEDIIEFVLNVKGIRVKLLDSKDQVKMTLKKNGHGKIEASDIEVSEGIEIVNPDHYLGSLSDKKSKIDMEMTVERGFGYSLAEERKISTVGVIPIDAIFSPVLKVSYRIEQTRVGRQTNYDKLIIEVWTDSTVDSREVLDKASNILVSYFTQIYNPKFEENLEKQSESKSSVSDDIKKMTIEELDLPTRIYNSLKNAGVQTVVDLLSTSRKQLMGYRNLGAKSVSIIEETLKSKGIILEL